jgi:hypothetical protein
MYVPVVICAAALAYGGVIDPQKAGYSRHRTDDPCFAAGKLFWFLP